MATTFKQRTSAPTKTNKFYINHSKGGYNTAIVIDEKSGYVMPNCVGYAQGRFRELCNDVKVWSTIGCNLAGNAETFWKGAEKAGLKRGQTPKLGAIVVWEGKGSAAGHVAIVEEIKSNGDIVCSESGYNAFVFRMQTYEKKKGYLYVTDGSRPLLGFVYNPVEFVAPKTSADPKPTTTTTTTKTTTTASKPNPRTYKVQKGDSLWAIAVKFYGNGSRWGEIQKANNLKDTLIITGQTLIIP